MKCRGLRGRLYKLLTLHSHSYQPARYWVYFLPFRPSSKVRAVAAHGMPRRKARSERLPKEGAIVIFYFPPSPLQSKVTVSRKAQLLAVTTVTLCLPIRSAVKGFALPKAFVTNPNKIKC